MKISKMDKKENIAKVKKSELAERQNKYVINAVEQLEEEGFSIESLEIKTEPNFNDHNLENYLLTLKVTKPGKLLDVLRDFKHVGNDTLITKTDDGFCYELGYLTSYEVIED